jgi:GT2 family glycosyltransferase
MTDTNVQAETTTPDDSTPRVSVIVATYNRSDLLRKNLDAILDQDFSDYEALYVDDGSTDDTPEVLAEYARRYPSRLRVLRVPNGGQGRARNAGAEAARGELLLITDDDTVPPPNWIGAMLDNYARHDCDALSGGFAPVSMKTPVERYLYFRECILCGDRPKYARVVPAMSLLVPRELFWEIGGFIAEPIEDWVFCRQLREVGKRLYYDPSIRVAHHYQTEWAPAAKRMHTPAVRGIYDRLDRGKPGWPYTLYSAAKWITSPLWSLWRYPLDLWWMSIRMETVFFTARLRAYFAALRGKRITAQH